MSPSAHHALDRRTVKEIEKEIIKQSERHRFFRTIFSGSDKDDIAGWKSDLNRILNVFNVRSVRSRVIVANCPLFRLSWLWLIISYLTNCVKRRQKQVKVMTVKIEW